MTAYSPVEWSDFALAQLGASAALLGLVFVGMSINLKEFVTVPLLVNRALEAIVLLATVLIAATAVLIPHQSREVVGVELVVLGVATSLAVLGARMNKVKLLAFLLIGLAVGNILSALAPSLGLLLVARFLAGVPHGAYFGVAGLLAAEMIGPGARSRGLAIVLSGLTIANVVGVPAITRLGQLTSWRLAYVTVAVVFMIAMTIAVLTLRDPGEATESSPREEFGALRSRAVWLSVAVAAIGFAGFFAVDS